MLVRALVSTALAAQAVLGAPSGATPFQWGKERVQGVNLGGWLVLEPWITPDIFNNVPGQTAVDEFTLCLHYGKAKCSQILEQHWKTWITESDVQRVKSYGLNMVRIPIGFWAFKEFPAKDTPYVPGAEAYLDKAIGWCRAAGINVLIDLHGAPRSQNGFDNSGHRLTTPGWGTTSSVEQTLEIIKIIATKYATAQYADVVMGIELLNEPLEGAGAITSDVIHSFYQAGWNEVRKVSDRFVVMHDAFQPLSSYNGFISPSRQKNDALDHHEYQVFDDYHVGLTPAQHRAAVCSQATPDYGDHPGHYAFVGEWSAAMTDCATWLNGYKVGSRYDGTYPGSTRVGSCVGQNNIAKWSQQTKDDHRWYIETQMDAYNALTMGWIFWTLKTASSSAEWDLGVLVEGGVFPQPLSSRKFPKACSSY